MRDWFAAFAREQNEDRLESGATRATRAENPQKSEPCTASETVAQGDDGWATRATKKSPDCPVSRDESVAPVAHPKGNGATPPEPVETAENLGFSASVAHVAHVAQEIDAGVIAQGSDCWDAADWRSFYWERVGMRSIGGYKITMAQCLAYGECVETWYDRHPVQYPSLVCAGCGLRLGTESFVLPDGARVHWPLERRFDCLIEFGHKRYTRAAEALASMGVLPPRGWSVDG